MEAKQGFIQEGETGFLVAEHDVAGMSAAMLALARSPALAARMGAAATAHIRTYYAMPVSIGKLWDVILRSIDN